MQVRIELIRIDALAAITGSRCRADVLAALFRDGARLWTLTELSRRAGQPHQLVLRELDHLAAASVVDVTTFNGKRRYELRRDAITSGLRGFVRQTRGRVPAVRAALGRLHLRSISWLGGSRLFVLSSAPKRVVRREVAGPCGESVAIECMSVSEWLARIQKGDVLLRQARRAPKVWVVGTWADLVAAERATISARGTLRAALENWREQLSDEWDDDWDPAAVRDWRPSLR